MIVPVLASRILLAMNSTGVDLYCTLLAMGRYGSWQRASACKFCALNGNDTGQAWLCDKPLENNQRYLTAVSSDLLSQYKGV